MNSCERCRCTQLCLRYDNRYPRENELRFFRNGEKCTCACTSGYKLSADERTCEGILNTHFHEI